MLTKIGTTIANKTIATLLNLEHEYGYEAIRVAGMIKKVCNSGRKNEIFALMEGCAGWSENEWDHPRMLEDLAMEALDILIKGHGCESVFPDDGLHMDPLFEYVNTGDSYNATIAFYDGYFYITCMGDMVEYLERKGYKVY